MIPALRQNYGAVFAALLQVASYFLCPLHGGRHTKRCYIDVLKISRTRLHEYMPLNTSKDVYRTVESRLGVDGIPLPLGTVVRGCIANARRALPRAFPLSALCFPAGHF